MPVSVHMDVSMRLVSALVLVMALTACDDAGPQPAVDTSGDPSQISAETVEAGRVCAELTGYAPGAPEVTDAAMSKREKEYKDCVAAVIGGGPPELRGRSEEPPTP